MDQRRATAVAANPSLSTGVGDRQQLLEAPDVDLALGRRDLAEALLGELVVVLDVEPVATAVAPEGGVLERVGSTAVAADIRRFVSATMA